MYITYLLYHLRVMKKGQASVVGGIFAITIVLILFLTITYAQLKYIELLREVYNKSKIMNTINEKLTITLNYSAIVLPRTSTVTTFNVLEGNLIQGTVYSLDRAYDGDYVIVDTQTYGVITEDLIKNGEFDDDFNYWSTYAVGGSWRVVRIDTNNVAEFEGYSNFSTLVYGTLSQSFTVSSSIASATLKFKFYVSISGYSFYYRFDVYVNDRRVYTYYGSTNWRSVTLNVYNYLEPGTTNTIRFVIYGYGLWSTYITRIDSVQLLVQEVTGESLQNVLNMDFDIAYPTPLLNCNATFLVECNSSIRMLVYVYNHRNNVWDYFKDYFTEPDTWFWIILNITKREYLSNGVRIKLYISSPSPVRLTIDYLGLELAYYNKTGVFVSIKNTGSTTAYIISVWLINSTKHIRFFVGKYLGVNNLIKVYLTNSTFFLTPGCTYEVRVWTKVRSYEVIFQTPT